MRTVFIIFAAALSCIASALPTANPPPYPNDLTPASASPVLPCTSAERIQIVNTSVSGFIGGSGISDIPFAQNITISFIVGLNPLPVSVGTPICYGVDGCRAVFNLIYRVFLGADDRKFTDDGPDGPGTVLIEAKANIGLIVPLLAVPAFGYYDFDSTCHIYRLRITFEVAESNLILPAQQYLQGQGLPIVGAL